MSETIGMLVECSVMPSSPSISIWPSAVALPWLPMAGITNGSAPSARTSSPMARMTRAMLAMPRLPAVIAMRAPGLIVAAKRRTWRRVSPSMSSRTGPSNVWRARCITGSGTLSWMALRSGAAIMTALPTTAFPAL